jgi:hypothetical protein
MPDNRHQAFIFVSFQMDPHQILVGMTEWGLYPDIRHRGSIFAPSVIPAAFVRNSSQLFFKQQVRNDEEVITNML